MKEQVEMVREFMVTFGQATPDHQVMPTAETQHLRWKLCTEESKELGDSRNLVEYLDAIVDLLYVTLGSAVAAGIEPHTLEAAFAEVHASNMTKAWMEEEIQHRPATWSAVAVGNGRYIVRDSSGKVRKSPSYRAADLESFIA